MCFLKALDTPFPVEKAFSGGGDGGALGDVRVCPPGVEGLWMGDVTSNGNTHVRSQDKATSSNSMSVLG